MSGVQVNVRDTGYTLYQHYSDGRPYGGFVRCEDCKVQRDFVSNGPMQSWLELHATPGFFGCSGLDRSVTYCPSAMGGRL